MSDLTLVPPVRLGALLSRARLDQNASLQEISLRSAGLWTPFDLEEVERGIHSLNDEQVKKLGSIYGVSTSRIVPVRTDLHLDLTERNLALGENRVSLESSDVDEVLERYLALLYLVRNVTPGTELTLRDADVEVLSETLEVALSRLERRLGELMLGPAVPQRSKLFSRRLVVPAAGLLVALTGVGALILVGQDSTTPTIVDTFAASAFVSPPSSAGDAAPEAPATETPATENQATGASTEATRPLFAEEAESASQETTDVVVDDVSEVLAAQEGDDPAVLIPPVRIDADLSAAATTLAEQPAPTIIPTPLSTPVPTAAPTTAIPPTAVPTAVPTAIPPTAVPTAIPTAAPTVPPATAAPTPIPTAAPAPTAAPTTPPAPPQPVVTTYTELGAQAEALIPYNWRGVLPGWTINYQGVRPGYRGLTNTSSNTIDIYIKPTDSAWSIAGILTHEIAHAIDVEYMTSAQREEWLIARGMPMQWWPGSGAPDFAVGAGDFAEAIAAYLVGSPSDSRYGAFTSEQLQLAASFLP